MTATTIAEAPVEESLDHASSVHGVPEHNWRAHWLTAVEFARMMGRRPKTIYGWVEDGTMAEFGIPICRFRHGKTHSGRVFIQNIC